MSLSGGYLSGLVCSLFLFVNCHLKWEKFNFFMCACVHATCVCHMCLGAMEARKGCQTQELESQQIDLGEGARVRSFAKATSALHHWIFPPTPALHYSNNKNCKNWGLNLGPQVHNSTLLANPSPKPHNTRVFRWFVFFWFCFVFGKSVHGVYA